MAFVVPNEDALIFLLGIAIRFEMAAGNADSPPLPPPPPPPLQNTNVVMAAAILPSLFKPPLVSDTPSSLFQAGERAGRLRFIRRTNNAECLIKTSGFATVDALPKAGCAFALYPFQALKKNGGEDAEGSAISFPLENHGPDSTLKPQAHTMIRAEIRAVLAALQYNDWWLEGFTSIVIATDLENVVKDATERFEDKLATEEERSKGMKDRLGWPSNGWLTAKKQPVKNKDLWELVLQECRKLAGYGVKVSFWRIPAIENSETKAAAKKAAEQEDVDLFVVKRGV